MRLQREIVFLVQKCNLCGLNTGLPLTNPNGLNQITSAPKTHAFHHTYLQELCVDLELGYRLALLCGGLPSFLNASEEVPDCPGNDAQLLLTDVHVKPCAHGVGLSRTSLGEREKKGEDMIGSITNDIVSFIYSLT